MSTPLDWLAITTEAVRHLQDLLRVDTTNPPGNELVAAEYLAGVLRAEGYDPIVLEAAPQRGNLIARLKGDGSLPPCCSTRTWMSFRPNLSTGLIRLSPAR